jgi:non-heme chloroperoxidase
VGYIPVGTENSDGITLYYEDHGAGTPVLMVHGYPLSSHFWEKQTHALLHAGYRVITYDRRGFGRSSQPTVGYDIDTLTHDLYTVVTRLDLYDTRLVGHSMGTGEVTRYLGTYGSQRVNRAALLAPLPPYLLRTQDNPEGVRQSVFDAIMQAIVADRPMYMRALLDDCFNLDVLEGSRVSEQDVQLSWNVAVGDAPTATLEALTTWLTDFRADLPRIDVPTLIIQGDQDRIFPITATGIRLPALIRDVQFVVIEGGPHAITWTHAEQVNRALLDFLGR